MRKFDFCGLEMHSRSMWYHSHVKNALEFMEDNGFNALIFHQSDILNHLVLPKKYLDKKLMWEKFRGMRMFLIESNRNYINKFVREANRKGIDFYFSLKEIYCPDEILEVYPFLVREKNVACPTDPFWWGYIEACIEDLCETVPGFKGVILSSGTHEARTSLTKKNPCTCERCKNTNPYDWYYEGFKAVYGPLKKHGKGFVVRDFSNTAANQSVILKAATAVSKDVIISLKNTPHDYFPTFPDNPKIGTTGQKEWIEFDSWGQFYGSGIFPASIAEDIKKRMDHCHKKGAVGVYFRTDWEGMFENSTFSTPNMINLYAGGLLAGDVDADLDRAYEKWGKAGWIATLKSDSDRPLPVPPANSEAWKNMRDFVKASWEVMRKTVYVRTHWFCEDNMFPDSLDIAFRMMVSYHGRDQWDPGASDMVKVTEENMEIIFQEKEQAIKECKALARILKAETLGFPQETLDDISEMFALYLLYCNIGKFSCRTVFLSQRALDTGSEEDRKKALDSAEELLAYRDHVIKHLDSKEGIYPHIIYWLVNENRMRLLAEDAKRLLEA